MAPVALHRSCIILLSLVERCVVSTAPHHHIFTAMVTKPETPICKAYLESKRSYCERHNYTFKYYEDRDYIPSSRHYQEPLSLRLHLARTYLFSGVVKQLTYMDFDTFIIQPEKTLESIYAAEAAKHDFPCTVFVQADPYVTNSGFWSVVNTPWVRNIFLPSWDRLQVYAWQHAIYFDQAPFGIAILHAALAARKIALRPCFNLRSQRAGGEDQARILHWSRTEKTDFPGSEWHQPPKLTTYQSNLVDKGKNHRTNHVQFSYSCANYFFEKMLQLPFANRSFRVSDTDGVCFMGFDGTQMNRHHFIPERARKKLNLGKAKVDTGDIRHQPTNYGSAYSDDLFMIHAHLEKMYHGVCDGLALVPGEAEEHGRSNQPP